MKKIFVLAIAAVSFAACNNTEADTTTGESSTSADSVSSTSTTTPSGTSGTMGGASDTALTSTSTTTSTSSVYTAADGDVVYRDKKVKVMKGGKWVDADNDVKLDNDVVVSSKGKVRKAGKEVTMKEGEIVNRTGNFFDKSGHAIENAWGATKEGAKDLGNDVKEGVSDAVKDVKKATKKAGDKVGDATDKDNKN